jgi:hypothetical protein
MSARAWVACALLFGAGCGKVEFTTTWTLDAQPGATLDAAAEPDAAAPMEDARSWDTVAPDTPSPPQDVAATDLASDAFVGPGSGIALAGQSPSTRVGGTSSGTPYLDLCPQGQVVIGYRGIQAHSPTMPWLESVQTQCGTLAIGPAPVYAITVSTGTLLPMRGGTVGDSWSRMCPSNAVVVGFGGRSSGYVDQLSFRCAPLMITGGPGSYTVSIGSITTTQPTDSNSGFAFTPIDCPSGQIAIGSNITADNFPRSLGLICATPMVSRP